MLDILCLEPVTCHSGDKDYKKSYMVFHLRSNSSFDRDILAQFTIKDLASEQNLSVSYYSEQFNKNPATPLFSILFSLKLKVPEPIQKVLGLFLFMKVKLPQRISLHQQAIPTLIAQPTVALLAPWKAKNHLFSCIAASCIAAAWRIISCQDPLTDPVK